MIHVYYTGDENGTEQTWHGVGIQAYNDAKAEADELGIFVYEARYEIVDTSMVHDGRPDLIEWRETWAGLADESVCDAIDGAEYERVTKAWLESDRAEDMEDFIRREANRGSNG